MAKDSSVYREWFNKAKNDLKAAKAIFEYYEEPPTDTICYHCHQVAEKSLKAFLMYKQLSLHKIHDLIALLNICIQKNKNLNILREDFEILNKYYIETKYPPDIPINYSKDEAKEAIKKAELIFKTIKVKIR